MTEDEISLEEARRRIKRVNKEFRRVLQSIEAEDPPTTLNFPHHYFPKGGTQYFYSVHKVAFEGKLQFVAGAYSEHMDKIVGFKRRKDAIAQAMEWAGVTMDNWQDIQR